MHSWLPIAIGNVENITAHKLMIIISYFYNRKFAIIA